MIDNLIKDYEGEVKALIYNKHEKPYVFSQYLAYQTFVRSHEHKKNDYNNIRTLVLDYIKK